MKKLTTLITAAALFAFAGSAGAQTPTITPNYKDADIRQIIEAVSEVTGQNFIIDPRVKAEVTMLSSSPMSPDAFYEAFLSILEVHGYVAVPAGDLIKIVPDANARQVPGRDLPSGPMGRSDELVTQVIQVDNVGAAQLVPILRPLIPQYGHLAAHPDSNMLIISDRSANVARMASIIRRIDSAGGDADVGVARLTRTVDDAAHHRHVHTLDAGMRWVLLIGVPAAAGLMILARPVLSTLFQYDDFGQRDIDMAALALISYAFGLPAFMLVKVLAPAFYARQDARTPVKVAVRAMVANMVLNVLLVTPLVWFEIPGAHAGLALATALAGYLNAGLLFHYLRAEAIYRPAPGWPRLLLQRLIAIAVMLVAVIWSMPDLPDWAALSGSRVNRNRQVLPSSA